MNKYLLISFTIITLFIIILFGCDTQYATDDDNDTNTSTTTTTVPAILKNISVTEAKTLIDKEIDDNPDFMIIDLRTSNDYNISHIEEAVNYYHDSQDFDTTLMALTKENKFLIYCYTGNTGDTLLNGKFKDYGFKEVYNIDGGFTAWKDADYPTVTGSN